MLQIDFFVSVGPKWRCRICWQHRNYSAVWYQPGFKSQMRGRKVFHYKQNFNFWCLILFRLRCSINIATAIEYTRSKWAKMFSSRDLLLPRVLAISGRCLVWTSVNGYQGAPHEFALLNLIVLWYWHYYNDSNGCGSDTYTTFLYALSMFSQFLRYANK